MGNRRLPTAVKPRNLFPVLWSPGCHKPCPRQESPGWQLLPLLVPTGGFTPATPQSSAAVSLWLGARWKLTALRSLQSRSKYLKRQKWGCTEDGLIKYLQCFFSSHFCLFLLLRETCVLSVYIRTVPDSLGRLAISGRGDRRGNFWEITKIILKWFHQHKSSNPGNIHKTCLWR